MRLHCHSQSTRRRAAQSAALSRAAPARQVCRFHTSPLHPFHWCPYQVCDPLTPLRIPNCTDRITVSFTNTCAEPKHGVTDAKQTAHVTCTDASAQQVPQMLAGAKRTEKCRLTLKQKLERVPPLLSMPLLLLLLLDTASF